MTILFMHYGILKIKEKAAEAANRKEVTNDG